MLVISDIVIADISIHNANVFYELGIRHALRDKGTFLIRCPADDPVFDLQTDRYLSYDRENPAPSLPQLIEGLRQTIDSDKRDSPVFLLLPAMQAQRSSRLIVTPDDFREEVKRANVDRQTGDQLVSCIPDRMPAILVRRDYDRRLGSEPGRIFCGGVEFRRTALLRGARRDCCCS